jgi:hypothetical protein
MNNKIVEFIQRLESQQLNTGDFHAWSDRQSGVYTVRASFIDGRKFAIHVTEEASINTIKTLSQANLREQFAEMSEFRELFKLSTGKRYTIASMGDFGFCNSTQFTLEAIRVGRYAQYDHCVELIVKPKGKRNLRCIQFYGRKVVALWTDWIAINTGAFGAPTQDGPLITRTSRYLSCDERFLTDAISSAQQKPLITCVSIETNMEPAMNNQNATENVTSPAITLASQEVRIEQTMTTPSMPGKKPRPEWVVSGNTFGLEAFFRDIGGKKFRGAWSFFSNPTDEISEQLATSGRSTYAEEVENRLERKTAKADRYESYAHNAEQRANSASARANSIAAMIPMGEPTLVGHHSEGRHRRDLKRIDSGMRKALDESKKADYFADKVSSLKCQVAKSRQSRDYIGNRIQYASKELIKLNSLISGVISPTYKIGLEIRIANATEKLQYWTIQQTEAEILARGGKVASTGTVKVGDEVYFCGWLPVVRINRKTVTVSHRLGVASMTYKLKYTKIKDFRTPAAK